MRDLPKPGDAIPAEKFHVSKMNVRAEEPFGESEEDQVLIDQLRHGKLVAMFKARLEGDGFGVYVGRRRFLAKKQVGVKSFVVGSDVVINDISEDEAREESLLENLSILRKEMDPVIRARKLEEIVAVSPTGLRGTARRLGLSPSTLSEWLKVMDLSPKMQEAVKKGLLFYTDALRLAKMEIGEIKQDELAGILESQGMDAFREELERMQQGKLKRGIPTGKYIILRTVFDKNYRPDMELIKKLGELAKKENTELDDYCKKVLQDHVKAAD